MVQHGSSRGAVLINGFPETYYFNPFSNLSPAQQLQKFGQHPPAALAPSSYSGQNVGRSPGDSGQVGSGRCPFLRPRRPTRSRSTPDAACRSCCRRWPPTIGRLMGFPVHIPLAPGSGIAAQYYGWQKSGYVQVRPFVAAMATRPAWPGAVGGASPYYSVDLPCCPQPFSEPRGTTRSEKATSAGMVDATRVRSTRCQLIQQGSVPGTQMRCPAAGRAPQGDRVPPQFP